MNKKNGEHVKGIKESVRGLKNKLKAGVHKKNIKRGIILIVIMLILGIAGAFALEQYEKGQDAKKAQAETTMILAQAKLNDQVLIEKAVAKASLAEQIGIDISNINFKSINLGYLQQSKREEDDSLWDENENQANDMARKEADDHKNSQLLTDKNNDLTPVYKVECRANSVEYNVIMDAINGTFYSINIDD